MDPEESSIERLKRTLYSRDERLVPKEKRTPVAPREVDIPTNWGDKPDFSISPEAMVKRNNSFFNKFLLWSLAFFSVSVCAALFIFFVGFNMISSNNVDIEIVAPTSISSGEELNIGLSVINGNRTDLEGAALFIDYPEGSYAVSDETKPINHDKISLDTVEKGGTVENSVRTILFGEKDTVKSFVFRLEYKVKGSNAVFSKEKIYDVIIGSSPILLEVSYPKEVNSGQEVTVSVELTSNSSVPIKDALIKVEYPYGYTYKSSNINPVRDNSIWSVGDLKNGDKKKIDIRGVIVGQNLEDRSFRISAGTKNGSAYDFDEALASSLITMGIRKSFFDLNVTATNNAVAQVAQTMSVSIKWQNTLPDKVVDTVVEAKISGNAGDRSKVGVLGGGFYRSVDDTVFWDKNNTPPLAEMSPGDSGTLNFTVASLDNLVQPKLIKNPYINVAVVIKGERAGRDGGEVTSTENLVIKVSTVNNLTAKTLRDTGPFSNTGPIPPKADTESTYTVNWSLTNTTNDVKDGVVRATLPIGVSWKGSVSPASEKISFDPDTRIVTWDIGNIAAGAGFTNSAKQAYFKVGIIPSLSQIGSAPDIVSRASFSGTDIYTERKIEVFSLPANTRFSDSNFVEGKETVVK